MNKKGIVVLNTMVMLTSAFAPVTNALGVMNLTASELPTMEVAEGKQKEFEEEIKNAGYVLSDSNIYTGSSIRIREDKEKLDPVTTVLETEYETEKEAENAKPETSTNTVEEGNKKTVTVKTYEVKEKEIDVTEDYKDTIGTETDYIDGKEIDAKVNEVKENLTKEGFKGKVEKKKVYDKTFYDEGEPSTETKTNLTKEEADAEKAKEVNNNEKKVVVTVQVNGKKVITVDEKTCSTIFYDTEEEALAAANALKEQLESQGYVQVQMSRSTKTETRLVPTQRTETLNDKLENECSDEYVKTVFGRRRIDETPYSETSKAIYGTSDEASVAGQNRISAINDNNTDELENLTASTYSKEDGTVDVFVRTDIVSKNKVTKEEYDQDLAENANKENVTVTNPVIAPEVIDTKSETKTFKTLEEARAYIDGLQNQGYDVSKLKIDVGYTSTNTFEDQEHTQIGVTPNHQNVYHYDHLDIIYGGGNGYTTITYIDLTKEENQETQIQGRLSVSKVTINDNGTTKVLPMTASVDAGRGDNEYKSARGFGKNGYITKRLTVNGRTWNFIIYNESIINDNTIVTVEGTVSYTNPVTGKQSSLPYTLTGKLNGGTNKCQNTMAWGYDLTFSSINVINESVLIGANIDYTYTVSGAATKSENRYSYDIKTDIYRTDPAYKYGYKVEGIKPIYVPTYTCVRNYTEDVPTDFTMVKYEVSSDKKEVEAYDVEIETTPKTERNETGYIIEIEGTKTHKETRYYIEETETSVESTFTEEEYETYNVEVNGNLPENPKTYDATTTYAAVSMTSIIGMLLSALALKKRKNSK